jgi:hypothetical protein
LPTSYPEKLETSTNKNSLWISCPRDHFIFIGETQCAGLISGSELVALPQGIALENVCNLAFAGGDSIRIAPINTSILENQTK